MFFSQILRLFRQTRFAERPAAEKPSPLKGLGNSVPFLTDEGQTRHSIFRKIDPGLMFVLAMSLFAILPELAHPGLFVGHDTLNHAFRVGEVARLWSQGIFLPRWAETFYFGYGSPVFEYYAPLTYTLSAGMMRLFGLDGVGALRLLVILCLPGAGVGMYLFMRAYAGKLAGILAALVYLYSPYIVFTEPVTRGDYPELLAFALFPFVMWGLERLLQRGWSRDFVLCALLVGIFALAHNLMSALLFTLLVGWLMWRKLFRNISWAQFRLGLASALLGAALAGFFWLPIFLQRNEVQLGNVPVNIQSERDHLFGFFVPLNHLLAPSPIEDAGAANGTLLRLNVGIAQWILALAGLIGFGILWWRNRRGEMRTRYIALASLRNAGFFAIAAMGMIALMIPLAYPLWTAFTELNFLEFPWRLLGPIAFCLAVLAGMNAEWIERLPRRWASIVTVAFLMLPVIAALPTLYVPVARLQRLDTSPAAYLRSETTGQTSPGTSARNDFLPRAVKVIPGATQSVLDDYGDGDTLVNKTNPLSIPQGSRVTVVAHTPESDTWQVSAAAPFTLETFTFYFAGWSAEIDGQPVPVTASKPHGFIRIDIPAGEHTVRLFLADTPARIVGIVVSLIAATLIALVGVRLRRDANAIYGVPTTALPPLIPTSIYLISFSATACFVALLMREGIAWANSPLGTAQIAQHQIVYNLGEEIQVLGYDVSAETPRAGDWLQVVIYWYAREKPAHNYSSFVHFSAGFSPLAQADKPYPAERATSEWTPGAYRRDEYSLHIPYGTAPGAYNLNIGLYTCDTRPAGECGNGDRLLVANEHGKMMGDILPLATLTIAG